MSVLLCVCVSLCIKICHSITDDWKMRRQIICCGLEAEKRQQISQNWHQNPEKYHPPCHRWFQKNNKAQTILPIKRYFPCFHAFQTYFPEMLWNWFPGTNFLRKFTNIWEPLWPPRPRSSTRTAAMQSAWHHVCVAELFSVALLPGTDPPRTEQQKNSSG